MDGRRPPRRPRRDGDVDGSASAAASRCADRRVELGEHRRRQPFGHRDRMLAHDEHSTVAVGTYRDRMLALTLEAARNGAIIAVVVFVALAIASAWLMKSIAQKVAAGGRARSARRARLDASGHRSTTAPNASRRPRGERHRRRQRDTTCTFLGQDITIRVELSRLDADERSTARSARGADRGEGRRQHRDALGRAVPADARTRLRGLDVDPHVGDGRGRARRSDDHRDRARARPRPPTAHVPRRAGARRRRLARSP